MICSRLYVVRGRRPWMASSCSMALRFCSPESSWTDVFHGFCEPLVLVARSAWHLRFFATGTCNFWLQNGRSEVGKKAQRPTGNASPAPTHPHRTHDTTDQWRETVQWLGRFWRKVSLSGSPSRPTSNRHHRCYELKTTVIIMNSVSQCTGIIML